MNNKPITKSQLAEGISERVGVTKKVANEFLDELASIVYGEVKRAGQVSLPGIGKLVLDDRKARKGRNPATGETIDIPAKKVVKFRVAKVAKDSILG